MGHLLDVIWNSKRCIQSGLFVLWLFVFQFQHRSCLFHYSWGFSAILFSFNAHCSERVKMEIKKARFYTSIWTMVHIDLDVHPELLWFCLQWYSVQHLIWVNKSWIICPPFFGLLRMVAQALILFYVEFALGGVMLTALYIF